MTFDELSLMAFRNDPLPASQNYMKQPRISVCKIFTGATSTVLFQRIRPQSVRRSFNNRFEDEVKKHEDSLKDHQYIDHIRVAFGGQFKAVKESGCPVCRRLIEILDGRNLSEGQDS